MKNVGLLATLVALAPPLLAATQTVALSVPDMNCTACPITVKMALRKVSGVSKIDVDLDRREVKVTFDDGKTTVDALTRAPARIAAIDAPALREGVRAEICVIDTERTFTVRREELRSKSHNTPFLGKTFTGAVVLTLAGGRIVHDAGGGASEKL